MHIEMVTVASIIIGITFYFTFHMCCVSIVRSLLFRNFSSSFLTHFWPPEIATSISVCVCFFIISDYVVWFIVRDGSVGLHLLIPQYDYLAFLTCLC